jgi:hypothetical protein
MEVLACWGTLESIPRCKFRSLFKMLYANKPLITLDDYRNVRIAKTEKGLFNSKEKEAAVNAITIKTTKVSVREKRTGRQELLKHHVLLSDDVPNVEVGHYAHIGLRKGALGQGPGTFPVAFFIVSNGMIIIWSNLL